MNHPYKVEIFPFKPYPPEWPEHLRSEQGWGCGYVHLPPEHPWHGVPWTRIDCPDFASGLTYSRLSQDGDWIIGFDTAHSWDTADEWPESEVLRVAHQLAEIAYIISITPKEPGQ